MCRRTDLRLGAIEDKDVRHRVNAELARNRRAPIDDVNLQQNDVGVRFDESFEYWADPPARAAPFRVQPQSSLWRLKFACRFAQSGLDLHTVPACQALDIGRLRDGPGWLRDTGGGH